MGFELLNQCDVHALKRFARWLRVEVPEGSSPKARHTVALAIARHLRHA